MGGLSLHIHMNALLEKKLGIVYQVLAVAAVWYYTRETKRVDEVTRNTSWNQTETWRCQPLQNMPRYNHLTGSKYVFKEEQITLDIPEEGVVLHSG